MTTFLLFCERVEATNQRASRGRLLVSPLSDHRSFLFFNHGWTSLLTLKLWEIQQKRVICQSEKGTMFQFHGWFGRNFFLFVPLLSFFFSLLFLNRLSLPSLPSMCVWMKKLIQEDHLTKRMVVYFSVKFLSCSFFLSALSSSLWVTQDINKYYQLRVRRRERETPNEWSSRQRKHRQAVCEWHDGWGLVSQVTSTTTTVPTTTGRGGECILTSCIRPTISF